MKPRKRSYIITARKDFTNKGLDAAAEELRRTDLMDAEVISFPSGDNILEDLLCQAERDRIKGDSDA